MMTIGNQTGECGGFELFGVLVSERSKNAVICIEPLGIDIDLQSRLIILQFTNFQVRR